MSETIPTPPPFRGETPVVVETSSKATQSRSSPSSGKYWLSAAVIVGIFILAIASLAWPSIQNSLKIQNKSQQIVLDWVLENSGDPRSIKIIEIEGPRKTKGGQSMVRVKYRSTNALGGKSVATYHVTVDESNGTVGYHEWNHYRWPTSIVSR